LLNISIAFFLRFVFFVFCVFSLGRGMAELTKGTNVTVNTILPGPTATEGLNVYFEGVATKQGKTYDEAIRDYFETVEPTSLIQRLIKVEEIASVVAFYASEHAAAINGTAQRVEGGIVKYMS
jgi:NAD(P)-dependent dehydrogenase (short-subunit alcohol dehydrogenase family)